MFFNIVNQIFIKTFTDYNHFSGYQASFKKYLNQNRIFEWIDFNIIFYYFITSLYFHIKYNVNKKI